MAATTLGISIAIPGSGSRKKSVFSGHPKSIRFNQSPPSHTAVVSLSRRRRNNANPPAPVKEIHKETLRERNLEGDDEIDEDAFDALFSQLEEDLKNDGLIGEDGDDDFLSEEELAKLEHELAEALEDDELLEALVSIGDGDNHNEDDKEESDNLDDDEAKDEEEESPIKLKNWQSRRLAYALKNGRRKTSIKNLAADLCLDRAVVLKLLRDPPSNLVMLSAALPDKPVSTSMELEEKIEETVPSKPTPQTTKPKAEVKLPVHEMRNNWSARKRLKKVQIETLELVYGRTKRPTNSMISSIVFLTNLPRKRVVKWFEDKRAEDEVPDKRLPFRRSASQTVFTS
ncbi:protein OVEREXPRESSOR OF CATIONIC PEROXIDASE 3 [Primulina tabacum]|uniref:protein OVEREXPRESSOR OF CATIONIC PEROXIDASE 3 n=1 Tax=Primulina tabacum TaxID=48773 RepID=UPI003F5A5DA7